MSRLKRIADPTQELETKAKEAWSNFEFRGSESLKNIFIKSSKKPILLDVKRSALTKKSGILPKVAMSEDEAAIKIQKFWFKRIRKPIHINPNHWRGHAEFYYFLNVSAQLLDKKTHRLKNFSRSLHPEKLALLKEALQDRQGWKHPIMADPEVEQLAITLYIRQQITRHQFYTLLMRSVINTEDIYNEKMQKCIKLVKSLHKTYAILDEKGEFTKEANNILLPKLKAMKDDVIGTYLKEESLPFFKLLIASLPLSEQVFFTSYKDNCSLYQQLYQQGAIWQDTIDSKQVDLHLSAGVQDAFGITVYGEDFCPSRLLIGEIDVRTLKNAIIENLRPASIFIKGSRFVQVHGDYWATRWVVTRHDYYHLLRMSSLGRSLNALYNQFIKAIIACTGIEMSREIWDLTDRDHFSVSTLTISNLTARFCKILFNTDNSHLAYGSHVFTPNEESNSLVGKYVIDLTGIILILHMLENPDEWRALGINFKKLTTPIKEYFNFIKGISTSFKEDPPQLKVLKIMIYLSLKKHSLKNRYKGFCELIKKHPEESSKLRFAKVSKKENEHVVNTLVVKYEGQILPKPEENLETYHNLFATFSKQDDKALLEEQQESKITETTPLIELTPVVLKENKNIKMETQDKKPNQITSRLPQAQPLTVRQVRDDFEYRKKFTSQGYQLFLLKLGRKIIDLDDRSYRWNVSRTRDILRKKRDGLVGLYQELKNVITSEKILSIQPKLEKLSSAIKKHNDDPVMNTFCYAFGTASSSLFFSKSKTDTCKLLHEFETYINNQLEIGRSVVVH